jgi:uncharacterized membrane protein
MARFPELQCYEDFLLQSRRLLDLAEASEWETFEKQLESRKALVARLEAQSTLDAIVTAGLADELRLMIAEIHSVNDRLEVVAEAARDELGAEIRQNMQANKAINAYKG